MTTVYLTVAEVLEIHEHQVARYGGSAGLRDMGQLESALFRPQSGYYQDILAEAAALWESLSQNHPFVDGNKRTAFASVMTFLDVNGITIVGDGDSVIAFLLDLYARHDMSFENLDAWLRENTRVK